MPHGSLPNPLLEYRNRQRTDADVLDTLLVLCTSATLKYVDPF